MSTLRSVESHERGEIVGASWRAEERIACGGMGEVWRGWHRRLPVQVAIKRLRPGMARDPEMIERFEREAATAAKMGELTSGAVRVFDAGFDRSGPFLVMEWLSGETLAARHAARGRFSLREATRILAAIAEVVRVAHAARIVHRDLKLDNVVAVPQPGGGERIVVIDWGVVKILEKAKTPMPTLLAGTPEFMSREVALGRPIDERADLWSVVVMLYAMITGKLPFSGEGASEVMRAVRESEAPPPSSIHPRLPVALDAFFERGFARDIEDRFRSIDELASAFRAASRQAGRGKSRAPSAANPRPPTGEPVSVSVASEEVMNGGPVSEAASAPTELMGVTATLCSAGREP